jgi:hypothetical protein
MRALPLSVSPIDLQPMTASGRGQPERTIRLLGERVDRVWSQREPGHRSSFVDTCTRGRERRRSLTLRPVVKRPSDRDRHGSRRWSGATQARRAP